MTVDAILIAGPTASGKSGLALVVAEKIGGALINADSMQVYREARILTARPNDADLSRAPHHLYGHVSVRKTYSAPVSPRFCVVVGLWWSQSYAWCVSAR